MHAVNSHFLDSYRANAHVVIIIIGGLHEYSTLIGNWNKESLCVGILALEASLHLVLARCSVTPYSVV